MKRENILRPILVLWLLTSTAPILLSQQPASGTVPVTVIATVEAKHAKEIPNVYKQDVKVFHNQDRLDVTDWTPCQDPQAGVELFVLVDDASDSQLALQFGDLKKFIQAQPQSTAIGIGYARNGTVDTIQKFTQDHAQAAKALRVPLGVTAVGSPYLSLTDLIKGWPQSGKCREVLMISSGIDYLQGGPNDTYLQDAIDQAQRAAVEVNAIYAPAVGHAEHSFWRLNWGQNNLSELTDETGGEFYIQGLTSPIAFAPYLDQFAVRLQHQFRLTFLAKPGNKADFQRIRLETEVNNADLVTQQSVYVPAAR
jgi:hypothetical protein